MSSSGAAAAGESPYCQKVRARAASDAALLVAPTVRAEALKLPSAVQASGRLDPVGAGSSFQVRAGLSLSAINVYKGTRLSHVADADCAHHEATIAAQELLAVGLDVGRLAALRSQVEYLESRRAAWEALTHKMEERFEAKTSTLLNVEEVRSRARLLVRRHAQVEAEVRRIEAVQPTTQPLSTVQLIAAVETTAMRSERESSHVRSLEAWDVSVTGGYLPPILDAGRSDFFGLVQVSYNVGAPWRNASAERHLAARAEELKTAKYELHRQLEMFREQARRSKAGAMREREVVESAVAQLRRDLESIEHSDAPSAFHASAMLELELIGAEAEQRYLSAWIRELSHMEEN